MLASTSSLYGGSNPLPFTEDQDTSRPLSPYAASKKGAEALTYTYHHLHGIDVTVFRYFTVYGPAGRPDMSIFRFCRWIAEGDPVEVLGDGHQSRDFTYVDDIARGHHAWASSRWATRSSTSAATSRTSSCGPSNSSSRRPATRRTFVFGPSDKADVRATWANVEKARSLLGWESQVSLEEGIHRSVAWYKENRELASRLNM